MLNITLVEASLITFTKPFLWFLLKRLNWGRYKQPWFFFFLSVCFVWSADRPKANNVKTFSTQLKPKGCTSGMFVPSPRHCHGRKFSKNGANYRQSQTMLRRQRPGHEDCSPPEKRSANRTNAFSHSHTGWTKLYWGGRELGEKILKDRVNYNI